MKALSVLPQVQAKDPPGKVAYLGRVREQLQF